MEALETSGEQDYKVSLDVFEGPLDLLLHLIKKDDLNIYDIPISRLLDQYLEYLNLARELDIDIAGEFVEMASELAYIKSKMLLPEPEEDEEEGPDPRAELMRRLLEYRRYKLAAQSLMQRPLLGRDVFTRLEETSEAPAEGLEIEADTASLLTAFQNLLKRLPAEQYHEIRERGLGVAESILQLTERLKGQGQVAFEDLFEDDKTRGGLVLTFLAILEMAKQRLIRIIQEQVFHRIFICPLFSEGEGDGIEGNP